MSDALTPYLAGSLHPHETLSPGLQQLVADAKNDPALVQAIKNRLDAYAALGKRLQGCFVSRQTKTLLEQIMTEIKPDVPAGESANV